MVSRRKRRRGKLGLAKRRPWLTERQLELAAKVRRQRQNERPAVRTLPDANGSYWLWTDAEGVRA